MLPMSVEDLALRYEASRVTNLTGDRLCLYTPFCPKVFAQRQNLILDSGVHPKLPDFKEPIRYLKLDPATTLTM